MGHPHSEQTGFVILFSSVLIKFSSVGERALFLASDLAQVDEESVDLLTIHWGLAPGRGLLQYTRQEEHCTEYNANGAPWSCAGPGLCGPAPGANGDQGIPLERPLAPRYSMWSMDLLHQRHLGACWKCGSSGSTLNQQSGFSEIW